MRYEVSFGTLRGSASGPAANDSTRFRLALVGDFSARANRGELETGDALATRKPIRVDVDNLDDVIERLGIQVHLPIGDAGGTVTLSPASMDDFHPDQLYEKLEIFSKLASLRNRLMDSSAFPAAAKAVQSLLGIATVDRHESRAKARGTSVPNAKLSDFARLVGRPTATETGTSTTELIKQVVRSHIVPDADPRQEQMVAAVDESLSDAMRRVLHHPDFQSLESLWRCVELLVRRLESGADFQIVLYDITAEEFAADLAVASQLQETGLYKLLVEQPALDQQQGPLSAIVANYTFEQTPPHADLLGRIAKIVSATNAPFIASISNECLKKEDPDEIHPVVKQSWNDLRGLPEARYLALTVPRFMLRWPYGKKTDPIESFEFEEFTRQSGVRGMLWGSSAFLAGLLLGETYRQQGLKQMQLGSVMTVGEMPYYYYTDSDGDQVALPCTDRLLSQRLAQFVGAQNFIPLLSMKGRPEVRLGGFRSLAGDLLGGPWAAASGQAASAAAPAQAEPTSTAVTPTSAPALASAAPEPEPAAAAAPADDELDALLADLGDDTAAGAAATPATEAPPAEPPAAAPDDELDALLAGLGGDSTEPPAGEDAMDPDLAALLGDL